jgi:hypothetical protein
MLSHKVEGKGPLERPRRKWKAITEMNFKEVTCENVVESYRPTFFLISLGIIQTDSNINLRFTSEFTTVALFVT